MKEIVTVQVGSFANFVGSHFWNFQDEMNGLAADSSCESIFREIYNHINMDVLYRSGETHQGTLTYTPRLLSIDCQGSLGCLSSRGELHDDSAANQSEVTSWNGNVEVLASERRKRNTFLQRLQDEAVEGTESEDSEKILDEDIVEDLEKSVEFWTDFSKVYYHPRSLYELKGLWTNPEELNNYGVGRNVYSEELRGEEIMENLRFFVEECDHIQGFQFIVSDCGGFSAIASDLLEDISDNYSNIPVLLYNAMDPSINASSFNRQQFITKSLQDAISFARLASFSDLIIPVDINKSKATSLLHIDYTKSYHSSAVYAAALHSFSFPFRMSQNQVGSYASGAVDMSSMVQILAGQGRQNKLSILDLAIPCPSLSDQVEPFFVDFLHPLTSEVAEIEDSQSVEAIAVHGALAGGRRGSVSEISRCANYSYEKATTRPLFSHLSVSCCPLPIPLPFPRIFGDRAGEERSSVPLATRLRSSSVILPFLEMRLKNLRRLGTDRGAPGAKLLSTWGFGRDDAQEFQDIFCKMTSKLDDQILESSDSD